MLIYFLYCFHLGLAQDELGPRVPLWTLVSLGERGLVRAPAALLVVKPQGTQTHPLLQVIHPVSSNVYQTRQGT